MQFDPRTRPKMSKKANRFQGGPSGHKTEGQESWRGNPQVLRHRDGRLEEELPRSGTKIVFITRCISISTRVRINSIV